MATWAGQTACAEHYAAGQAPRIVNTKLATQAREICYSRFGIIHSGVTRTPLWTAEHLTATALEKSKKLKRVDSFHEETSLPRSERAELRDYSRSGYDRGHMAPNGNMPDTLSQAESFSLANIVPQDPDNNRGLWEGIESAVRTKAKKDGELYVITGPLFMGANIRQINGRVMVPTSIYKAVYDPRRNEAAAYIASNAPGMQYEVVSLAELEKIAGINFFPALPDSVKARAANLPTPTPNTAGRGGSQTIDYSNETKVARAAINELLRLLK